MDETLESVFSSSVLSEDGLRRLVEALPQLKESKRVYAPGEAILGEGESNDQLFILVEGRARLLKNDDSGRALAVDAFGPGALIGLTSFWGRTKVFASVEAEMEASCVSVDRTLFDALTAEHPRFARAVTNLFVRNLSERYRGLIRSRVAQEKLSNELAEERNQLRDAMTRLEHATNKLINQEKLVTMGQLLAGIAHEINNPVGAMLRGIESASGTLELAFSGAEGNSLERELVREGCACPYWSAEEKRERMDRIMERFPGMSRSLARRYAQLSERALQLIEEAGATGGKALDRLLAIYELGVCLRAVRLPGERIEKIVTSLRNYGKQDGSAWQEADLAEGIRDTMTVLNNRLKHYDLILALDETPPVLCRLGEINQVWTNLLVNAMDATPKGGKLWVSARTEVEEIVVRIEDSGTGISPDCLEKVFEPNYTTKNASGNFGLGLGLAISREIVEKHGGSLVASNRAEGGACFEVRLPLG